MNNKFLFFILVFSVVFTVNATPPDPCDDCYIQYFEGLITEVELEDCIISSGCQDVPINLSFLYYILFISAGSIFYFIQKRKVLLPLKS